MMEDLQRIYSKLADKESKDIFEWRLLYAITGKNEYLNQIIKNYAFSTGLTRRGLLWVLDFLLWDVENYDEQYPIVVYGCGDYGAKIYHELGEKIYCFCDSDKEKQEKEFCGKRVMSLEELAEKREEYRVIIGSPIYYFEIYEVLQKHGIRLAVDNTLKMREWTDVINKQYFDKAIISYVDNEVFIDGGSLDYSTAKQFLKECPSVKKIYAFEPDVYNACICKEKAIKVMPHCCEVIEKGLYKENTELYFKAVGDGTSRINEEGECVVEVCAIDQTISEPVTFIKMDIEGAELDALKGAAETIKKHHPKLAICIYHKPEDVIEIPKYILELNPDYKLYMRHYSNFAGETIVYAV